MPVASVRGRNTKQERETEKASSKGFLSLSSELVVL
jgi:hypothetical protein